MYKLKTVSFLKQTLNNCKYVSANFLSTGKIFRNATTAPDALQAQPKKTSLYNLHVNHKGKLVDFAGYLLPVQYSNIGISASHLHTRNNASIFDVSHMLQTYVRGKDAIECFESICTADIKGLNHNSGTLTVFTNEQGGILDDLIVTKVTDDLLYVVSNAACREQDSQIILECVEKFRKQGKDVSVEFFDVDQRSLIAVQGPKAVNAVEEIATQPLNELYFMQTTVSQVAGVDDCRITRCGYTGEDGVEISIPADKAETVVNALLSSSKSNVQLAGLGARDSLRLEAGLCLYGSDIDQQTTPVEAGLAWLVAKRRRTTADFPGAQHITAQLKNGCEKRRVGIRLEKGPPARHDVKIYANNQEIGVITSGCPSPSLGGNVAMGYVRNEFKDVGTKIDLKIRDKFYSGVVAKMPFVPAHYYTKKK